MGKTKIIEEIANSQYIEHLVAKMFNQNQQYSDFELIGDLSQDIYVSLLELSDERIESLYTNDELKKYIQGIVCRNINSKTSPFYYKYKKYYKHIDDYSEAKTIVSSESNPFFD